MKDIDSLCKQHWVLIRKVLPTDNNPLDITAFWDPSNWTHNMIGDLLGPTCHQLFKDGMKYSTVPCAKPVTTWQFLLTKLNTNIYKLNL